MKGKLVTIIKQSNINSEHHLVNLVRDMCGYIILRNFGLKTSCCFVFYPHLNFVICRF